MIGVIDSGLGGLAVVDALALRLPSEDIVYFGDTACAPYGNRSPALMVECGLKALDLLRRLGADTLVVASHSLSCVAIEDLVRRFPGRLFDAASPAAEAAARVSTCLRIGVAASRAVAGSPRYPSLIRERIPGAEVFVAACPLWAPLVAEGWVRRRESAMVVKRDLRAIRNRRVDTLIPAGSCFGPLHRLIERKMGPRVAVLKPAELLVARVVESLQRHSAADPPSAVRRPVRLFFSELTPAVIQAARRMANQPVVVEQAP
jgi:glutamate racemase